ncbi:MAG: amino acid adenylation domain-containing protein, partial [Trueperaceae bacterium]
NADGADADGGDPGGADTAKVRPVAATTSESPGDATTERLADASDDASDAYPLSSEQLRFWYLERLHPGTPAYHVSVAARLRGRHDHEALEWSLREVVARHEMLRSAVHDDHGTPVQRILPPRALTLPVVEIGEGTPDAREAELQRRITEAVRRPFDLSAGRMLRATSFRLGPEEHVLLLVVHHIVSDAWAVTVLVREIAALYAGTVRGEKVRLPPPPARYLDHVERQRAAAHDASAAGDLAYWRRQLADAPTDLRLPAARRPYAAPSRRRGGHVRVELSEQATSALREFSRREGVTPFMTLLAAFQTLLHRHAGDDDLCVATAASTRSEAGAEHVVGCYLDTLVLRSDLSGDPTFRELLAQVRGTTLAAFEHRSVPFDEVVRALRPERGPDGAPLFRAMLVLHNARVPQLNLPGLELEQIDVESGAAVTDLALILDDGERLRGALEYDADRFDVETVQHMAGQLQHLLEVIPDGADRPVGELPLEAEADARRRAAAWRGAATDFGPASWLHRLVEAQVDATPDAVAIESEEGRLDYAEMDRRAERLADRLHELGVAPGRPVGVCVPRSADRIVAALAVLKAGGAYLPLAPAHPDARLHGLLADDAAVAVVVRPDAAARFEGAVVPVVTIDAGREEASATSRERADRPVGPEDAAYLVPTSGTTGAPKIVVVPHRAIVHQVRWRQSVLPLSGDDAVLFRTPVTFDPSVWEMFGPLTAGARVVVPPADSEADAAATMRVVAERGVSVLQATPSVLDAFLAVPDLEACRSLRAVFCGGEPLSPELAERCLARLPAELHHLYGPSETTIDATHWRCRPGDPRPFVPLGRPVANTTVHVLDRRGLPAPVGVPGELIIVGPGVAHGYLNRPDLARDRFVPDPLADREEARAYRTGDVGRWLPDGTLEFLGRDDRQVKVRGVRVEPAEVEAVLRDHEAVRQASVVPYRDPAGGTELAAFVTAEAGVTSPELERRLAERLPVALIPTVVHVVDALPRTGNDKVDLARLTARAQAESRRSERSVGPRTDTELRLLRLWREHFPDQEVGVSDDFFELGGHSLSAMRLMARVGDAFDRDVPVSALIEGRTVAQLARLLDDPSRPRPPTVLLRPRGDGRPLFLVHPASGSAFAYQELADALGDARPVHGLEAPDPDEAPDAVGIEALACRYADVLAEVQPDGPYLLAGWSMGGVIAYETARRIEGNGASVAGVVLMDAWVPDALPEERSEEDRALARAFLKDLGLGVDGLSSFVDDGAASSLTADLDRMLAWARHADLVPPDLDRDAFEARVQVFARHVRAMRAYRPGPYSGRLQLFEATEPLAGVRRDGPCWDDLARGGVTRDTVPGDHYSMMRRPHVDALAARLQRYLERSEAVAS